MLSVCWEHETPKATDASSPQCVAVRIPFLVIFGVTGHFIQICPAFLRSDKVFSGRASRVSRRQGILLLRLRNRFPPLSPFLDFLFAREGRRVENQHVGWPRF